MKPNADEDMILTGDEAAEYLTDSWRNIGMGKVNVEVRSTWLIVRRTGGNYSTFISFVDDTVVTILDNEATTRHVPKELRPDSDLPDDVNPMLKRAFTNPSTGMYPTDGGSTFQIGFREDGENLSLNVSIDGDDIWFGDSDGNRAE